MNTKNLKGFVGSLGKPLETRGIRRKILNFLLHHRKSVHRPKHQSTNEEYVMQVSTIQSAQPQIVHTPTAAPRATTTQSSAPAGPVDQVNISSIKPQIQAAKPVVTPEASGIEKVFKPIGIAGALLGGVVGGVVGKAVGDFVSDLTGSKELGQAVGTVAGAATGGVVGGIAGAAIPGFCPHGGATLAAISGAKEAFDALSS